ncbi:spore cortex biosynthesis protein YabQ [Caloramator sp. Dgby_cultured_2]|uniref:spore cortex biosynthesis protein YabQ n=1 Tax=Caloramator sp. Dgby_cultured_2 TaxID=3029174 RepID=UPI00406CCF29
MNGFRYKHSICIFFSNVLCGIFVGLLFDIYRVIRGFKTPNKILTAISDILFGSLHPS